MPSKLGLIILAEPDRHAVRRRPATSGVRQLERGLHYTHMKSIPIRQVLRNVTLTAIKPVASASVNGLPAQSQQAVYRRSCQRIGVHSGKSPPGVC